MSKQNLSAWDMIEQAPPPQAPSGPIPPPPGMGAPPGQIPPPPQAPSIPQPPQSVVPTVPARQPVVAPPDEPQHQPGGRVFPAVEQIAKAVFNEGRAKDQEIEKIGRSIRRVVYLGGFGSIIAIVGATLCMVIAFVKMGQTPVYYYMVHENTGEVDTPVSLDRAKTLINEDGRRGALRTYIEWREGYVSETRDIGQNRVRLMSSESEMARFWETYREYKGKERNMESPLNKYGVIGNVRVSGFKFHGPDVVPSSDPPTYIYRVFFKKSETIEGEVKPTKDWIADIDAQFDPAFMKNEDERSINPNGLRVISYKVYPDDRS